MRLVRSLSGEFKFVKEHIQQAVAAILSDITTLVDIKDFSAYLRETFTANGHLQQFAILVVQPSKKNLSTNKAGIEEDSKEEDPEKKKEYLEKFNKNKVVNKVETAFNRGAIEVLRKF